MFRISTIFSMPIYLHWQLTPNKTCDMGGVSVALVRPFWYPQSTSTKYMQTVCFSKKRNISFLSPNHPHQWTLNAHG